MVRTDFADDARWMQVRDLIIEGEIDASADIDHPPSFEFHDTTVFEHAPVRDLLAAVPPDSDHQIFFVVDETTMSDPDLAIAAVEINGGRAVRVLPELAYVIWTGLLVGTTSFDAIVDIAGHDDDGLYR